LGSAAISEAAVSIGDVFVLPSYFNSFAEILSLFSTFPLQLKKTGNGGVAEDTSA